MIGRVFFIFADYEFREFHECSSACQRAGVQFVKFAKFVVLTGKAILPTTNFANFTNTPLLANGRGCDS